MKNKREAIIVAASVLVLGLTAPASAYVDGSKTLSAKTQSNSVVNVHWKGKRKYRAHHHRRYRNHRGGSAAIGFAAGAIVGSAVAARPYYRANAVEYCLSKYRSYDPARGTYLGYDGYRHPCP